MGPFAKALDLDPITFWLDHLDACVQVPDVDRCLNRVRLDWSNWRCNRSFIYSPHLGFSDRAKARTPSEQRAGSKDRALWCAASSAQSQLRPAPTPPGGGPQAFSTPRDPRQKKATHEGAARSLGRKHPRKGYAITTRS